MFFEVANWTKYQGDTKTMKNGQEWSPPWLKLYHRLLDDYDFSTLPEASRFHFLGILMLAARTGNRIRRDEGYLQHQLRTKIPVDLAAFRKNGWIRDCPIPDDSVKIPELFPKDSGLEESRGDNKREDIPPLPPQGGDGGSEPADFLVFWKSYPKKTGKGDALKAWKKAKRPPIDKLLLALDAQKRSEQWTRDGGRFVPNPATWLNQGRWGDEPQPPSSKRGAERDDYARQF